MRIRLRKLPDQVLVITGASSGIGLATAELAAGQGARVVLNARNAADLTQVVERIRRRGGDAIAVAGDVADDEAMDLLAQRAVDAFGRIDTWVNNAGVGIYGRSWELPLADKRRLFDVNFWGVVHGCRSALRHMRAGGGAIINIGSVASDRAVPLLGVYSASKFAVKGYTDALRMEIEEAGLPIAVTLVKPAAINTPFTEHARNYMDAEPEFVPPVYAPEEAAYAILKCAVRPTREVIVGGAGRMMSALEKVAPRTMDRYMERALFTQQKKNEPPHTTDSLWQPQQDGRRRGSTSRSTRERSTYTRAALSGAAGILPVLAIGTIVAAAVRSMRKAG